MNSETPETDQQAHWTTFEDGFWGVERCSAETGTWVPIDVARRLELRCKRLEEALRKIVDLYGPDDIAYLKTRGRGNAAGELTVGEVLDALAALADQQEEKP